MNFPRTINSDNFKTSSFLFGPRLTGKTTFLKTLKYDAYFDLLNPDIELEYKSQSNIFWQEISALKEKSMIIVDEIQRIPILLNLRIFQENAQCLQVQ